MTQQDDPLKYIRYDPSRNNLLRIAAKSFALGLVVATCFILQFTHSKFASICLYLQLLSLFHSLEFISTYLFNNSQVDDDSFILEDREFQIITILSIIEHFATPNAIKVPLLVSRIGYFLIALGQVARTLAMYTAQESFNHYIQKSGKDTHILITKGIYKYIRHPSYFGFFIWFLGMQLMLRNVIVLFVGCVILWRFFRDRVRYEEKYLVEFFGDNYIKYRNKTRTWMFI
ncbi:farnesyl cysteine-carboxyl methyltransferase [Lodderomyces elongisporus]|uniref:Protein-S-isoprenylcysteine O-methyltransferase n=1 Tax=Lodderomyces elongisporus (strain ATCC 11503 / CBS 2605 / JCM 1781 / NBRC 1676 / NRRL YB-4239) TaxID=379508 RepID=A5E4T5_LODEL|nr:farnesyl cysteine-carboxyl methyltransferase [Lodderomyces elongisporus]EDK46443.1 hypothetical protein LELG_04624 [Lodderomyces elongisporus NRRL YB-4239]WLF81561.1 farnesyl cysteine-carboxyl methyltransferase [Lodderomyces elongisporus]